MNKLFHFLCLVICVLYLISCNSDYSVGKKKGYFHIDFPDKKYQPFDQPGYPYTFEYPVYAKVTRDSTFFNDKAGDWWVNIDLPQFAGRIYISYKTIGGENKFDSLVRDGFKMAYKQHVDVSTGIEERRIMTPNNVEGMYFSLGGNTATANQFFLTDSTKHFLRGALYFNAYTTIDSVGPVIDFIKRDIGQMIKSFRFE